MYSSSESTASTEPIDKTWALPAPIGALKECYLNRSYYEPNEEILKQWEFEDPSANIPICKKKETPKVEDNRCKEKKKSITKWMTEIFKKDTRNFEDILKEERELKEKHKKTIITLRKHSKFWCAQPESSLKHTGKRISYVDHYYNYPGVIISLGHGFVHYKKMLKYIRGSCKVFHFDLRYTTEKLNTKIVEHIKYARKLPNPDGTTEAVFGGFFLITGRILETGMNIYGKDVYLDRDSTVLLTADRHFSNKCNHKIIYINFADYVKRLLKGDLIEIGDEIKVIVENEFVNSIECTVINGGLLKSQSRIRIPTERTLPKPPQVTREEEFDVMQAFKLGCDFIVVNYPFSPQLITFIHWVTAAQHRSTRIYTKIDLTKSPIIDGEELYAALETCFGVFLYLEELVEITPNIKTVFQVCFDQRKSIIWEGLFDKGLKNVLVPTDDEMKKYMFLYPECICVKSEDFGIKSRLRKFVRQHYPEMNRLNLQLCCNPIFKFDLSIEHVFLKYVITSSLKKRSSCIIVTNNSGKTVSLLAKFRPIIPIVTSFCDLPTCRRIMLLRNVYSLVYYNSSNCSWNDELELRLSYCVSYAKELGFINKQYPFIYCFDSKRGIKLSDSYRILALDNITIN